MSKKKKNIVLENIKIESIAAEGKAIARHNDKVIFIPYAVPGDIIKVRIIRSKSSFMEGIIEELTEPSPQRIKPFCSHFGICGGCKWQILPYSDQLKYKEQQVSDQFKRIGHLTPEKTFSIIPSDNTEYYRNKLEFTFSPKGWLTTEELKSGIAFQPACGFHIPGKFDKIIDIDKCYLQNDISNKIRKSLKELAIKNNIDFHNVLNHTGLLRTMIIRTNNKGDVMLIVSLFEQNNEAIDLIEKHLLNEFKEIKSLIFYINSKHNDSYDGLSPHKIIGDTFIEESLNHVNFKISPLSFFQTNTLQAAKMYKKIMDLCDLKGNENIYDLYSGTGTIANYIAPYAKKVLGIEYIEEAVKHAVINSSINRINNTEFIFGDMKDILKENITQKYGKPDIIITDPPRAGMHSDVIEAILKILPKKIIYVSCNPATQARDIALLKNSYKISEIHPIDMFPHTHHVENIALLTAY